MTVNEVSAREYANIFPGNTVYNTSAFTVLNSCKCDNAHFLIFRDSKARLGLILGEKDSVLLSPFSAPFGGFSTIKQQSLTVYLDAIDALKEYISGRKTIITLPPYFYDADNIAKTAYSLEAAGAERRTVINYHFSTDRHNSAEEALSPDQKRNYRIATASGNYSFQHLASKNPTHIERVYDIISKNRSEKGYYLAMTLNDVMETVKIVPADLFIVQNDGIDIASALVYRVTDKVAQVIYWGDLAQYAGKHPMTILTTGIFNYYKNAGLAIVDAGPAGNFDELNQGLCAFKERIGCTASVKYQYIITS